MGLPCRGNCAMVPGGRSGRLSGKVRRYGVNYFGLPWRRRLTLQDPAGLPWLPYSMNGTVWRILNWLGVIFQCKAFCLLDFSITQLEAYLYSNLSSQIKFSPSLSSPSFFDNLSLHTPPYILNSLLFPATLSLLFTRGALIVSPDG